MNEPLTEEKAVKDMAKTIAGSYIVELGMTAKIPLNIHVPFLVKLIEHSIEVGRSWNDTYGTGEPPE